MAAPAAPPPATTYAFDSFGQAGTSDDDRVALYAAHVAQQTFHGAALRLDASTTYRFTRPLPISHGFAIVGPGRPVDQGRKEMPLPNQVRLEMDGGWLRLPSGKLCNPYVAGLSFDGHAKARLFEPNPDCRLWLLVLRDISCQNIASLLGSKTTPQPVDFFTVDGFCNLNNFTECAWNLGGSDCYIRPSGANLDTPKANIPDTGFLQYYTAFGQSFVDGIYLTAEGHSGALVRYQNEGALSFTHGVMMGRNDRQPCNGAVLRIEGGDVSLQDMRLHHGMANPKATGRNDGGVVHIAGGNVQILASQYRRAAGVSQDVPFVYVSGGTLDIAHIQTCGRDGWTAKPVVVNATGHPDAVIADKTVRVIPG